MAKVWDRLEFQAVFAVQGRCSTRTTLPLFRLIKLYQPHMTALETGVPLYHRCNVKDGSWFVLPELAIPFLENRVGFVSPPVSKVVSQSRHNVPIVDEEGYHGQREWDIVLVDDRFQGTTGCPSYPGYLCHFGYRTYGLLNEGMERQKIAVFLADSQIV